MKRIISLILMLVMTALTLTACPAPAPAGGSSTTTAGSGQPDQPAASVSFSGDFTVTGESALLLTAELAAKGISVGAADSAKKIIVGESTDALLASAKSLATARLANYGDYAIVTSANTIAVYGASEYATRAAIDYLLGTYAKNGAITVTENISYAHTPKLLTSTIGGAELKNYTVVYEDAALATVATSFAEKLSALCGYKIPVSDSRSRTGITIRTSEHPKGSENYTVSCSGTQLVIEADDLVTLVAAAGHFATVLPTLGNINGGDTMTKTPTYKTIPASNTDLIKYCGTWQATVKGDPDTMVSYWNAAYAEIDFTGIGITVEFSQQTTYKVKIDDGAYSAWTTTNGKATFVADTAGKHTIRIYSNDRSKHMYLRSFTIAESEQFSRTPDKKHYIQFVGDSISDAGNSFSHRVGDVLGWDFSVTALSGMALERDYGYWRNNHGWTNGQYTTGTMAEKILTNFDIKNVGMEDAFFKLGYPDNGMQGAERELYANKYFTEELDFNFATKNTPDIVFIFLGTNDEIGSMNDIQRFVDGYDRFVSKILETYGMDTQICILQALSSSSNPNNPNSPRFHAVRAAAENLIELFPNNVTFIDWDLIETWNVEISSDTTHPTGNGYDTLTEKISELLLAYYG